jgi:hypothetical protein
MNVEPMRSEEATSSVDELGFTQTTGTGLGTLEWKDFFGEHILQRFVKVAGSWAMKRRPSV